MEKQAYEFKPLTLAYATTGLKVGDTVMNHDALLSNGGDVIVPVGTEFEVLDVNPNIAEKPGYFIVYINDVIGSWGFDFSENGWAWYFSYLLKSTENEFIEAHGDMPYKIIKIVEQQNLILRADLINQIVGSQMISMRKKKQLFNEVDDIIVAMADRDYLVASKDPTGDDYLIAIGPKASELLNA